MARPTTKSITILKESKKNPNITKEELANINSSIKALQGINTGKIIAIIQY